MLLLDYQNVLIQAVLTERFAPGYVYQVLSPVRTRGAPCPPLNLH